MGVEEALTELRIYVRETGRWPQENVTFVVVRGTGHGFRVDGVDIAEGG